MTIAEHEQAEEAAFKEYQDAAKKAEMLCEKWRGLCRLVQDAKLEARKQSETARERSES